MFYILISLKNTGGGPTRATVELDQQVMGGGRHLQISNKIIIKIIIFVQSSGQWRVFTVSTAAAIKEE